MDPEVPAANNLPPAVANLPPGWRFRPSDEQLLDMLTKKRLQQEVDHRIPEVRDFYLQTPEELTAGYADMLGLGEDEWYFFTPWAYEEENPPLLADEFWKQRGNTKTVRVRAGSTYYGFKKTLVLIRNGIKTAWRLDEYNAAPPLAAAAVPPNDQEWYLCRVYNKRAGPLQASYN
ncbi:unnamed protein product [Cuscuta epithymum]|uniref:NAC domain-containing protein n=2 Tax=Cuscuta epithymum TaxID=186058 RepID=A0AAV0DTD3_9ASTE|nr:unnamed protein product [Cuscuta epithymum]